MHDSGYAWLDVPGVINGKVQPLQAVMNSTFQPAIDAKFGFKRGGNLQDISQLDMSSITAHFDRARWRPQLRSPSPHVASIVLRRVTGIDLKDYIQQKLRNQWAGAHGITVTVGTCHPTAQAQLPSMPRTTAVRILLASPACTSIGAIASVMWTPALMLLSCSGRWKEQQLAG